MSARRALRHGAPSASMQFVVELLMVLVILAVLNTLAVRAGGAAVLRARFSEALVQGSAGRLSVVERLALSGDSVDKPGGGGGETWRPRSASELLGRATVTSSADPPATRHAPSGPARLGADIRTVQAREQDQGTSRYVQSVRIEGAAVLVSGSLGDDSALAYDFALVPVTQEGRVPQVIVWQCERLAMPSGWTGPSVLLRRPPPEAWLPPICRRGGGRS